MWLWLRWHLVNVSLYNHRGAISRSQITRGLDCNWNTPGKAQQEQITPQSQPSSKLQQDGRWREDSSCQKHRYRLTASGPWQQTVASSLTAVPSMSHSNVLSLECHKKARMSDKWKLFRIRFLKLEIKWPAKASVGRQKGNVSRVETAHEHSRRMRQVKTDCLWRCCLQHENGGDKRLECATTGLKFASTFKWN